MQMVVNNDNKHETSKYRKLWGNKVDRVFCKEMHDFLVQKTSIRGGVTSKKQLSRCLMPFSTMLFFWTGEVGLCCWDYDNLIKLGHIETDSLINIYSNEKFDKIRIAMRKKQCESIYPCNACAQIYGYDGPQK